MKRLVSLLMALLLLATAIPALADEEPVRLTWFVDVPSFVFNSEGWGLDRMTAEFKERFGIEIEFVTAADESGSQLATLISSDSVPDIITMKGLWDSPSTNLIRQMAEAEMLVSYDELIDLYVPEEEKAGFRSDVLAWYALSDGKPTPTRTSPTPPTTCPRAPAWCRTAASWCAPTCSSSSAIRTCPPPRRSWTSASAR